MSKRKTDIDAIDLRRRAESMAQWLIAHPLHGEVDAQKLLHELQVHQVELEMQNAELRHAQDEMAAMLRQSRPVDERLEKGVHDNPAPAGKTGDSVRSESAALATMCGEMRIPLKVIAAMCRQIRRSGVDAENAKRIEKLDAAIQRLTGIIDAASGLSKRASSQVR